MRWTRAVPLTIASAVTLAAAGTLVWHDEWQGSNGSSAPAAMASAAPARPPVLADFAAAPAPTAAGVGAALNPTVARFPDGEQLVGAVVDVTSGAVLWRRHSQTEMAPASTTKLLTAAAALEALGPDFHLTTSTRQVGHTVYLVGGGDPTLVRDATSTVIPAYPQPATLAGLASQTAAALGPGATVRLRVDTSAWTGPTAARGWAPNYVTGGDVTPPSSLELDGGRLDSGDFDAERTPTPTAQAADAFVALLRSDGVVVKGNIARATAPSAARPLASVESPPLSALVDRMLTQSDNDLAEALGRAVAAHEGLPASFTGAAAAVVAQVAKLGVPTSEVTLYDTSGLSHDDRVDPDVLVDVLRAAASSANPVLRPLLEGLPIAGFTGTLADRYRTAQVRAGAGLVRAKTGTLTGVNTLAGVVVDKSGRLLAFALMAAGTDSDDAEQGLDQLASEIAALP